MEHTLTSYITKDYNH